MQTQRFKPLTPETMTPEQKAVAEKIMAGPRKGMRGPFSALLRSPELADCAQKLGEYVRFKTSIPPQLNELAILLTARHWTAQYEWYAHRRLALQAGLSPEIALEDEDDLYEKTDPDCARDGIDGLARCCVCGRKFQRLMGEEQ